MSLTWEQIEDAIRQRFEAMVQDVTTVDTISGSVFSMSATDNSINRSTGSFLTDGLREQYKVSVSGFTESGNNAEFRIGRASSSTKLLLTGNTVTTEAEGDSVSIAVRLPIHYDNAPRFEPPPLTKRWLWGAFTINMDTNQVGTGGNRRFRHSGIATAEFFAPDQTGTEAIIQLCQVTASAFRVRGAVSGVTFRAPSMIRQGATKRNVSIPFYADEVVAA